MRTEESLKAWLNQFKKVSANTPPLDLYFLGDGLGESIIGVLDGNYTFVIDAFGGTDDCITKTVLSLLSHEKINYMQVSHLHQDHYAGLNVLLRDFNVEKFGRPNLVKYQEIVQVSGFIEMKESNSKELKANSIIKFLKNVKKAHDENWANDPNKYLLLGNSTVIHDTSFGSTRFKFDCVAPIGTESEKFIKSIDKAVKKLEVDGVQYIGDGFLNKFDPEINRTSVINRLLYGNSLAFLTGDSDNHVIDKYNPSTITETGINIKTLLMKIPHHGSLTSDANLLFNDQFTSERRKIAILTPYDSQDLPVDAVIEKYLAAGYEVFRTSESDGNPYEPEVSAAIPDGIVHVRLESNGEATVSTWGTARQYTPQ